ncbi:hypothetical protein ZWY2020_037231 [Hordeum vulgare]|nr:hypothetical protein ZWY2020_037231 [Hordeum vulgare]
MDVAGPLPTAFIADVSGGRSFLRLSTAVEAVFTGVVISLLVVAVTWIAVYPWCWQLKLCNLVPHQHLPHNPFFSEIANFHKEDEEDVPVSGA